MAIMAGKKKNPSTQYAFIGLILALLGCISTGLIGVAKGMINLGMFTFENTDSLTLALQISIGLLVAGLAAYAFMAPDTIRRFLSGRQARYGSNSLILILAFIGIVVVANYLVIQNPGEPLFENKENALAPETVQTLATLPGKVTATAFYSTSLDSTSAEELLLKFKVSSKGKFDYSFVDPDLNPIAAREAGITGDGKIMLQMGETKEIASFADETELVRTIIRLISPEPRVVYFLEGHGEPSLEAGGELSYATAKRTLESKNYTVNTLNLISNNGIPEDALSVIVAGPLKPLTDEEVSLLKEYVNKGGSLVVMEDPRFFTEFGDASDPLAEYLVNDWGITLNEDIIIDYSGITQNALNAASLQYNSHPITQNLNQQYIVILPQARSISITDGLENIVATSLLSTSENSWGESSELVADQNPEFDQATDLPGPLTMAAAGENAETKGRVVVFGNSVFATDNAFDAYGNGNIFINSVDWAAEQEDLLNITPHESTPRTLNPIENWRMVLMIIIAIFVLPGIVVVSGISSWLTRRKRG
jgi:ABC-type uncharacterized transport system involved in gliding motility auxiliary subunit